MYNRQISPCHCVIPTRNGSKIEMKNKYDWFDENGKPDAKLHTVILEFLLSPTYRWPIRVTKVCVYSKELHILNAPNARLHLNANTNVSATATDNGLTRVNSSMLKKYTSGGMVL